MIDTYHALYIESSDVIQTSVEVQLFQELQARSRQDAEREEEVLSWNRLIRELVEKANLWNQSTIVNDREALEIRIREIEQELENRKPILIREGIEF